MRFSTYVDDILSAGIVEGAEKRPSVRWGDEPIGAAIAALTKVVLDAKGKWLRDRDVLGIVFEHVLERIGTWSLPEGQQKSIRELLGPEDADELRDSIGGFIDSIPRAYEVHIPVPWLGDFGADELVLSDSLSLVRATKAEDRNALMAGASSRLGLARIARGWQTHFDEGSTYVRASVRGYFDGSHDESAPDLALSLVKQLITFGQSLGVFYDHWYSNLGGQGTTAVCTDSSTKSSGQFPLPARIARRLTNVRISRDVFTRPRGLLDPVDSSGNLPVRVELKREDWPALLKNRLQPALSAIGVHTGPEGLENLRTAAEWSFDASSEDNETESFLFTSIAFEALLDSPPQEATKRMADRLGYLLGHNKKQRNLIASQYERFYGRRSDVVHGREKRLDEEARTQLRWGRTYLAAAIARELQLQVRDV